MVSKGTNNRHLQQELNTEVSCSAPTLELKEIIVNTLKDISSSNLPNFVFSDVAEDMILFAKQIFDQKKIRKSFINDNQYEVPQNTLIVSNYFDLYKNKIGEMQKTRMP